LWCKGESSGNRLQVKQVWVDCDADAVLYLAEAEGPSCHTGRESCFFTRAHTAGKIEVDAKRHAAAALPALWQELVERRDSVATKSYTRALLDDGVGKISAKIEEEANELGRALQGESDERVVSEAADVLYHVLVGLLARGLSLQDVERALAKRSGVSGLAEKAGRAPKG
jgi:phosphoribosyl-ATP pyrophosphohydrolase/phosphoribosyl-AMP cyclohydrolase